MAVNEVQCVAGRGLSGHRFFDFRQDYRGQVTFFASEVFDEICRLLAVNGKSPGVSRRNVITRGVDLNSLIGKKFDVQGVAFEGTSERSPCHWMDQAIARGAEAALHGRGGLRARILTDGRLRTETWASAPSFWPAENPPAWVVTRHDSKLAAGRCLHDKFN